jgi:exosortase A
LSSVVKSVASTEDIVTAISSETATVHAMLERRRAVYTLSILMLATVALHWPTYISIVQIWLRSETFMHGFLILPISAFLIWRRRAALHAVDLKPYLPGLLAVFAASIAWWVSDFLGLQVGKQFAAVALMPLFVLTLAGKSFAREIAFPLGYLVFAVPFGEAAIPYLIDFTASFTVTALQFTGIPVLRDGAFFSIPTGNFEVATTCSGIRYMLASLAIGTLYGYMTYSSLRKRLAFFLFALLLPIVANGLRAFGIVLLAYYSNMKIAVGVDHLIYGWIFFGFIILLMLWTGERFRDKPFVAAAEDDKMQCLPRGGGLEPGHGFAAVALATMALGALGPALPVISLWFEPGVGAAGIPVQAGSWRAAGLPNEGWKPLYFGATTEFEQSYVMGTNRVDLAVFRYDTQEQGVELANAANKIADPHDWHFGKVADGQLDIAGETTVPFRETTIHRPGAVRLVWSWNEVNGDQVAGDLETKLREVESLLSLRRPVSAAIIVSMPVVDDAERTRATLKAFLASTWHAVHECLYPTNSGRFTCMLDDGAPSAIPTENQIRDSSVAKDR